MVAAVCDSNQEDRLIIRKLLDEYSKENNQTITVEEYRACQSLCNDMDRLKRCQVIFLSINSKQKDGLQAAKKIKAMYPEIDMILISASIHDALEGYKVKATRFLVKDDLAHSITECLDDLFTQQKKKKQKIKFPFVEGTIDLEVQKIIYIETDRHKNVFYTIDAAYCLYKKLDELEGVLKDFGFVRTHRSFLVNMHYIEKISNYCMWLTNGKELSVPKSRYAYVKKEYASFQKLE